MRRADFRLLREIVSKIPGKILPKVLGSITMGHILGITSQQHRKRQFQNAESQADETEGWFG